MHVPVGLSFAKAIVNNEFDNAYSMLSDDLKKVTTANQLKIEFNEMIEYGETPVVVDGHYEEMTDWPAKQAGDIGWLYVSLSGDGFGEAVTLIIKSESGTPKIRDIEWGRP